jgi:hypothetical protein
LIIGADVVARAAVATVEVDLHARPTAVRGAANALQRAGSLGADTLGLARLVACSTVRRVGHCDDALIPAFYEIVRTVCFDSGFAGIAGPKAERSEAQQPDDSRPRSPQIVHDILRRSMAIQPFYPVVTACSNCM